MSITGFYDKTITVKRLATTTGAKKAFSNIATDVDAHIQPLDAEFVQNTPYILGKDFQMYCGIIDLQEGDRVVEGSHEYKVVGVEKYEMDDEDDHIEAIIRIFDQP